MRFAIVFIAVLTSSSFLYSQKLERITVKAGENQIRSLLLQLYKYPEFIFGSIHYKNGTQLNGKLNYHKSLDQIHFIKEDDTVAILNNLEIRYVVINTDSLFFDDRFIAIVYTGKRFSLGKYEKVRPADREERVTYRAIPNPGSSIESLQASQTRNVSIRPNGKKDIPLIKQTVFYLGDRHHRFTKLTRKNILMIFPGKSYLTTKFLDDNKINLDNASDLEKLCAYLETFR